MGRTQLAGGALKVPMVPVRLPYDGDAFDPDARRRHLMDLLDDRVPLDGGPPLTLHGFCVGHRDELILTPLVGAADFDGGAWYEALARRLDVHAVIAVATARSASDQLAVVLVEREGEGAEARWWTAWRPFLVEDTGLPRFLDAWKMASGGGPPPGPFARFVCARPGAERPILLASRAPIPDIRSTFGTLAAGDPTPESSGDVADLMLALCLPGMRDDGLDHAKVLRISGRDWELWSLGGRHLPAPLDDLIRLVASRGGTADAVGLLVGAAVDLNGRPTPALHLVVERGGTRLERLFGVRSLRSGAGIEPTTLRERGPIPIDDGQGWLGVDPELDFELSPMDAVDVE
jgi:hypothetical protein